MLQHCAFEDCTQDLANSRQGVFCIQHEYIRQGLCRIKDCNNSKAENSQTCQLHQGRWHSHITRFGRQSLLGVRRLLRRTEEERQEWLPPINREVQPHDQPTVETQTKDNYFVAPHFYCVETICAPCGVVIAWTKFDKSESPTKILDFLDSVYPTPELRPNYICIDKACAVLRTAIASSRWDSWRETTRFIVDSYHYINHRITDYLCWKWCNPAPLNGSAPNLVIVENDDRGHPHYKRAFNTQACEQLNAWIGGFQSILNKMTVNNFNWSLHALLFLHTQKVIIKQNARRGGQSDDTDESDEEVGIDIDRERE